MRIVSIIFLSAAMLIASHTALSSSNITIYLDGKYLLSTDTRQIEVRDDVCKQNKGIFSLKGNAKIPITICTSDADYGSVSYRNLTNNSSSWTSVNFLKNGDSVSP